MELKAFIRRTIMSICFVLYVGIDAAFVRTPGSTVSCDGTSVNLTWEYDNAEMVTIVNWKFGITDILNFINSTGNLIYGTGYDATRISHDGNGGITLLNVPLADAGSYTCTVSYTGTTIPQAQDTAVLSVYSPFNERLTINKVKKSDKEFQLYSSVNESSITYTWTFGGIVKGNGITYLAVDCGVHTLTMTGGRAECLSSSLTNYADSEVDIVLYLICGIITIMSIVSYLLTPVSLFIIGKKWKEKVATRVEIERNLLENEIKKIKKKKVNVDLSRAEEVLNEMQDIFGPVISSDKKTKTSNQEKKKEEETTDEETNEGPVISSEKKTKTSNEEKMKEEETTDEETNEDKILKKLGDNVKTTINNLIPGYCTNRTIELRKAVTALTIVITFWKEQNKKKKIVIMIVQCVGCLISIIIGVGIGLHLSGKCVGYGKSAGYGAVIGLLCGILATIVSIIFFKYNKVYDILLEGVVCEGKATIEAVLYPTNKMESKLHWQKKDKENYQDISNETDKYTRTDAEVKIIISPFDSNSDSGWYRLICYSNDKTISSNEVKLGHHEVAVNEERGSFYSLSRSKVTPEQVWGESQQNINESHGLLTEEVFAKRSRTAHNSPLPQERVLVRSESSSHRPLSPIFPVEKMQGKKTATVSENIEQSIETPVKKNKDKKKKKKNKSKKVTEDETK